MFENYPSLLLTKLYVPRLQTAHVSREPLLAVLDAGLERKLVLIAAAAGFGKTTLATEWINHFPESAAWLSLDDGDNDPARFLSYLVAAVQLRLPQVGQALLAALQSPQPPPIENALYSLINQLVTVPERLILVLDDYHVIENPAVHNALSFLLEHQPPHLTLVLLTRTDPPLLLAKLRARHELLEIRASDLRFPVEDTGRFLNERMQLALPAESIVALDARTEGWIAGLQLAALAMQTLPGDKQTFVHQFTGSHHFILDYLIEEVIAHQSDAVRRFLLQTSLLRRLNAALCSVVTGQADGQTMLDTLQKNNLFLIPLDQQRVWYRYHHLFADLLQARLQAESPELIPELQRRAARWHAENGFPEEAVRYALDAHDFEYAAHLITGAASSVMRRGEVATLLDWYHAFPADFVTQDARLALQFGLAFALNGRWPEAETLLASVEQTTQNQPPTGDVSMLVYLVASYQQDISRLNALAAEAAAQPHADRVTRMVQALVVSIQGDLTTACELMAQAQEASERDGDFALALSILFHRCRLHVYRGDLHQTATLGQQALDRIRAMGDAALPMALFAHVSLCRVYLEWNEPDKAAEHASHAVRISELSGFLIGIASSATIMLAEAKQAKNDAEGALETVRTALHYAERYDPPPEVQWLRTYQARLWLVQGNIAQAVAWLKEVQSQPETISMFYPPAIQLVTQARVFLVQRKLEQAVTILTRLAAEPRHLLTVEVLNTLALARQAQGDSVHALLTLEQGLVLAQEENRVRAFLDFGAPLAKLLTRFCETQPDHTYARTLLAAFTQHPPAARSVETLSDRELGVLRLIAAGHSNEEIAQSLTLAVSTVKWYINVLYGKLHVKTRAQAIARIHDLHMLD